jgi:hypothetical protein
MMGEKAASAHADSNTSVMRLHVKPIFGSELLIRAGAISLEVFLILRSHALGKICSAPKQVL